MANPKPFWNPWLAGIALGVTLLLTFLLTGHGLGATGFTTRLSAWLGLQAAPQAIADNPYLGAMARPDILNGWITWQVLGVFAGALLAAWMAGRLRVQLDGAQRVGTAHRTVAALIGGLLAGFGARVAAGCTSGLGLSGAATLSIAAFVFLGTFFVTGMVVSRLIKGV